MNLVPKFPNGLKMTNPVRAVLMFANAQVFPVIRDMGDDAVANCHRPAKSAAQFESPCFHSSQNRILVSR